MNNTISNKSRQALAIITLIVIIIVSFSIAIFNGIEYISNVMGSHNDAITAAVSDSSSI